MKLVAILVTSLTAFLLAAKAHGREIRLVREAAGYHHVVFGGNNPPFVDALWSRERVVFWAIAGVVFVGVAIASFALSLSPARFVWAALFVPLVAAFVVSGVRHRPDAGGYAWWSATLVMSAVATWLAVLRA